MKTVCVHKWVQSISPVSLKLDGEECMLIFCERCTEQRALSYENIPLYKMKNK